MMGGDKRFVGIVFPNWIAEWTLGAHSPVGKFGIFGRRGWRDRL